MRYTTIINQADKVLKSLPGVVGLNPSGGVELADNSWGRNKQSAYLSKYATEGSLEGMSDINAAVLALGMVLIGDSSDYSFTSVDGGLNEHVITGSNSYNAIPYKVLRNIDGKYLLDDVVADSMSLQISADDGKGTVTLGLKGSKTEVVDTETYSKLITEDKPLLYHRAYVNLNGAKIPVSVANLSINNNAESKYVLGQRSAYTTQHGERTTTLDLTLPDYSSTTYLQTYFGGVTSSDVSEDVTYKGLELNIERTDGYTLQINLPKCVLNTYSATVDGQSSASQSLQFTALYDNFISSEIQVTGVSDLPSIL